ncbi:MAG: cytochrome c [Epsilonproteobacteria bacterium]|nr:cytochrome c [Campylobacterota bacterium]
MKKSIFISFLMLTTLGATDGKKVFETYCWGCHHQTAVAFGPPFEEIASKRTASEIRAMITDPKEVSKVFGYSRNAMPSFQLSDKNLTSITKYILSFKPEDNKTIVQKPYPNIAQLKKEDK